MTEQLTDEERDLMSRQGGWLWRKALRIIDEQAKQLAAANALLGKFRTHFNAPGTSVFAHAAVRDIDALLRPVDSFTDIHDLEYREAQDAHLAAQPATAQEPK